MAAKKSSRADNDYGMLIIVIAFLTAFAFVNSIAINVSVSLQQGQAYSSTRCVMNQFSSSISTVR